LTNVNLQDLRARLAEAPPGPRVEFGVFRGECLREIARHDGPTIGVDSFAGMAEPTARDIVNGRQPYPKGRLAAPMAAAARAAPNALLIKGFVPEVLRQILNSDFSFAHVDLDHYAPTRAALDWLADRMCPGGLIVCDDWFAGQTQLAAGAINEFAAERGLDLQTKGPMAWMVL